MTAREPDPAPEEREPTAAEILAMAEQAEAEAAEAEALAAAARARARAVQLRQQAQSAEAGDDTQIEESDDDDASAASPVAPGLRILPAIATSLAVVAILALLAGSGYILWQHRNAAQQHQRAAEFEAAARQGVVNLTSLDFNNAKRDVQRILDSATGTFKDEFAKTADDFIKVVEQSKVVEVGTVKAAAVDIGSMTNDSAAVLVTSRSEVTNVAGAKQDPRAFRLRVTVARDGDQIKMSKVEFVP